MDGAKLTVNFGPTGLASVLTGVGDVAALPLRDRGAVVPGHRPGVLPGAVVGGNNGGLCGGAWPHWLRPCVLTALAAPTRRLSGAAAAALLPPGL